MLFLCLSDIHGHLDALKAVFLSGRERRIQKLLVAGDIVFPGPEPLETWTRLQAAEAVMVQGVTDRAIATLDPDKLSVKTAHAKKVQARMREVQAQLGKPVLQQLRILPTKVRIPLEDGTKLLLVHGSPVDPTEALTHDMTDEELLARIGHEEASVVVCGMSHVPFDRTVEGVRILNVGSVGEAPDGRETQEGAPQIAYATWIDTSPSGISVEQIALDLTKPQIP